MSWSPIFAAIVRVAVSPSTLPSVMVDLPVNELVVSPVTFVPSCLKVKVLSIAPLGPSAVAFQLPLMSAANALKANSATSAGSHFILQTPFVSRQYTLGRALRFHPLFRSVNLLIFATNVWIFHSGPAKDGTHDARRNRTPHRLPTRPARRRRPAAFVALRRSLRPANAGAIRPRRGARTGGPPGRFGRAQHP